VQVVALPDGTRVLRLARLETSTGPDLEVWVTDAPVLPDRGSSTTAATSTSATAGATVGSSGYVLPPDVDLAELSGVSIWRDRFNVSFGAAALQPVPA
jgi:hypothetical protein